MPAPEGRHTLVGTALPDGEPSPTLIFHKWQRYDCFVRESYLNHRGRSQDLKPFAQDETRHPYLVEVASRLQAAARERYPEWHRRFAAACDAVSAEAPVPATTAWRMMVGWATNPSLEVGLSLDPLYGFPFIPGSAVKGLLHRVAEEELLGAVPEPPPSDRPPSPPETLAGALVEARRMRALFGSLHLRPDIDEQPTSALVRLERWRDIARQGVRDAGTREAWRDLLPRLEAVTSDTATGGMVACFDAVPATDAFSPSSRQLLVVDVLTPHKDGNPNPISFLAVRDDAPFELRFRLAGWPAAKPRDDEEEERAEALAGWNRETVLPRLRAWLIRGLEEHGLGGKTSAGYGYLYESGRLPRPPKLLAEPPVEKSKRPDNDLPPAEREAVRRLPEDVDRGRAINYLDDALRGRPSPERSALVRRYVVLFPNDLAAWEVAKPPKLIRRARLLREALGDAEGGE